MRGLKVVVVFCLLGIVSCQKEEINPFNPDLYVARATDENGNVYEMTSCRHEGGANVRSGMARVSFTLSEFDFREFGLEQHYIIFNLSFPNFSEPDCFELAYSENSRPMFSSGFANMIFSDYTTGDMWLVDDFPNQLCITEVINEGEELVGTFQLQYYKYQPEEPRYGTPWPDTLTFLNGTFRSSRIR